MPSLISIDGQFKADIYNHSNELINSGDWAGNYVTSTGLSYPLTMPFADTFMYLSLGSGKQPSDLYTTGLWSGSKPHIYSPNGAHPIKYNFLWTTGIVPDGCGTTSHPWGVELFRAWRVPEDPGMYLEEDLHVSELMTSPATTGGLGITGTSYPDPFAGGKFSDTSSGRSAFNRVLKDFTVPSGDYAVVTYKMNFVLDKEVRTFDPFIGLNNAKGAGKTTWQKLTGAARIMHPGIQIIPSASTSNEGEGGGEGGGGGEEGGESTGPGKASMQKYGQPLEPSCSGNMYAYFSTDNTQYRFDPFWGGAARTNLQRLTDNNGVHHWANPIDNTYLQPQMRPQNGVNLATGFGEYFWNLADVLTASSEDNQQGGGSSSSFPTGLKHWNGLKFTGEKNLSCPPQAILQPSSRRGQWAKLDIMTKL